MHQQRDIFGFYFKFGVIGFVVGVENGFVQFIRPNTEKVVQIPFSKRFLLQRKNLKKRLK